MATGRQLVCLAPGILASAVIVLTLQGCGKSSTATTTTSTTTTTTLSPAACKPMTWSDPCYKACHPGMHCEAHNCTVLGDIGCNSTPCVLMGVPGSNVSHCMSGSGPKLGGFYASQKHLPGSFAGTRMISDEKGDAPGNAITLIGSDDGKGFWALSGHWIDQLGGKLVVNFSPRPLTGILSGSTITWEDSSLWSRMEQPTFSVAEDTSATVDLGGFYTDPNHYTDGSFAGTRMISDVTGDAPGGAVTLIGSDDGAGFWSLRGQWTDKAKKTLSVDFSPKGGPGDLRGTYSKGKITWKDGNHWSRQAMSGGAALIF